MGLWAATHHRLLGCVRGHGWHACQSSEARKAQHAHPILAATAMRELPLSGLPSAAALHCWLCLHTKSAQCCRPADNRKVVWAKSVFLVVGSTPNPQAQPQGTRLGPVDRAE